MSQSLWNFLRGRIWTLTAGLLLAGLAVLALGPMALWSLIAFALAAALVTHFLALPPTPITAPAERNDSSGTLASLRFMLDQLPMPVMLLDQAQRVLFVNQPMRALVG